MQPRIGDPVIRIAAAIDALIDVQPLLPPPPQRTDGDFLHCFRHTVGEVDVNQHLAAHAVAERLADDVRRETLRRLPMDRLTATRLVRLRQRERWNAEYRAFHRTGDSAGIDHVLPDIAAAVDT